MSDSINSTGTTGANSIPIPGQHTPTETVSEQDAENFASQLEDEVIADEEQTQKDELIDLMKQQSFKEFGERQKEMVNEIKKDFE